MNIPKEAYLHAEQEYPRESIGFIVEGKYIPVRNAAASPEEHAITNRSDYAAVLAMGELECMVHSHPDFSPKPSLADMTSCEESGIPWAIIEVRKGLAVDTELIYPSGFKAPLIGRPFVYGVHDCLSLVTDWFEREAGITFNLQRSDKDGWWKEGLDLYREGLKREGFERVEDSVHPRHGDIILMQIRSPKVPNHAAVYLADGILKTEPQHYAVPGSIIHHMQGQDSRRDIYGGFWAEKTESIWRSKHLKQ